jgi:hypothetical protein
MERDFWVLRVVAHGIVLPQCEIPLWEGGGRGRGEGKEVRDDGRSEGRREKIPIYLKFNF